jgi:hypothetical protein
MKPTLTAIEFVTTTILIALCGLAAIGTLNWTVDPFQHYREATRYPPRFYNAQQRFVNPGLAMHADYSRIVIGSSLMENIDTNDVDNAFASHAKSGRSINLSMSAMTAYDANQLLRLALSTSKPTHIIMNMDYNAYSGAPNRSGFTSAFPTYLYDMTIINDGPYLFGLDSILKSTEILRGARTSRFSENPARAWSWADNTEFSAAKTVRGLDANNLNKNFKQPNRTLAEMQQNFNENILPLVHANPNVTFSFVYLPYSVLVWADFEQRRQVEVTLQFRDYVFAATQAYQNVEWFDFQADAALVNNLAHYTDMYHFSPAVSRDIIRSIARNENRLTAETLSKNNQWLRETAKSADVKAIIAQAKQQ